MVLDKTLDRGLDTALRGSGAGDLQAPREGRLRRGVVAEKREALTHAALGDAGAPVVGAHQRAAELEALRERRFGQLVLLRHEVIGADAVVEPSGIEVLGQARLR